MASRVDDRGFGRQGIKELLSTASASFPCQHSCTHELVSSASRVLLASLMPLGSISRIIINQLTMLLKKSVGVMSACHCLHDECDGLNVTSDAVTSFVVFQIASVHVWHTISNHPATR